MKELTPKMKRQRKALLVLPVIAVGCLTVFFVALGGGSVDAANTQANQVKGLNTQLPDAKLKDNHSLNKLSYYEQATLDSAKLKQQMRSDPYYHTGADSGHLQASELTGISQAGYQGGFHDPARSPAANQARINDKLIQLQNIVNRPPNPVSNLPAYQNAPIESPLKLAKIAEPKTEDPELKQMSGLLEKILEIQHPERVKQQTDGIPAANNKFLAIPAIVDGKQKVTDGTVVRMKMLDSARIGSQLIPKGQLVYATGNLYNQRLTLHVKNIRIGYTIFPVDLTVYDMTDGLEGISVPEAVTGNAVKDGAVSGLQGTEFMSLDPSVSAQLAGAGINAAKGLFSKKVKAVKGKLKDGHALLLRDNQLANKADKR
jgi:hypothetical protein